VDAIYGTGVNAGGVFGSDAGFRNDKGHMSPPPLIHAMPPGKKIQGKVHDIEIGTVGFSWI
jgi:hypothetical protein